MIRALLEWVRSHKEGKLRALLYLYRWFRLSVIPVAYEIGIYSRPDRIAGYYALGNLLAQKYAWMVSVRGHDGRKASNVGRRAVDCFEKTIALQPMSLEAYQRCASLLFSMGNLDNSIRLLQGGLDAQRSLAERHQLDRLGLRFISPVVAMSTIGAMSFLDTYVKAYILGLRGQAKPILLVKGTQSVPNLHFLNYWREYVTVITDPTAVEKLLPLARYLEDPLGLGVICNENLMFHPSAAAMLYKQWEEEKRPPLLKLSQNDYERGWDRLETMGVPKGSWFVGLHVREAGFKDGEGIQDLFRNADIGTYLLAVKSIVDRGGWVIRMGNPTMKRLPVMEHVIDYANSEFRSDWMDVFLCAESRFFINNSSGLGAVAATFGVPYVLTNFLPTCALLFSSQDLFIPKLCRSLESLQYMSFEGLMSPPVSTNVMQHQFDNMGIGVVENSPEEINDLITEMLDRLDGRLVYSAEDERLQERFKDLTAEKGTMYGLEDFPINCRIGRGFLRKYVSLLPPADERGLHTDGHTRRYPLSNSAQT